jgi:hypothetical protein
MDRPLVLFTRTGLKGGGREDSGPNCVVVSLYTLISEADVRNIFWALINIFESLIASGHGGELIISH